MIAINAHQPPSMWFPYMARMVPQPRTPGHPRGHAHGLRRSRRSRASASALASSCAGACVCDVASRTVAIAVAVLLAFFWVAVVVAASANPDYSHSRDYISALASVGAERPWLAMLAIGAVGVAFLLTSALLRPFSRTAALAAALAGTGYLVAAVARIRCVEGAAACGVGDRQSTDLENTRGYIHETAVIGSTVLLVVAMVAFGIALLRRGRRAGGIASLVAASATVITFALVSGDSPGTEQRIWVAVMMCWTVGVALWTLARPTASPAAASRT